MSSINRDQIMEAENDKELRDLIPLGETDILGSRGTRYYRLMQSRTT